MEALFYLNPKENSLVFSVEKSKKSRNSIKMLLKNNEANAGLWVIYAEIEFMKSKQNIVFLRIFAIFFILDKNINEAKKIFETVLRVIDIKKKISVFYYYCNFLVRNYNEKRDYTKEFADNIILENIRVYINYI